MMRKNFFTITLLFIAALCLTLSSSASGQWKQRYLALGNNVSFGFNSANYKMFADYGMIIPSYFPKGSGNRYVYSEFDWGCDVVRDLDGNGTPEDTITDDGRGCRTGPGIATLENKDMIESLWANIGTKNMGGEVNRIENNRVWSSLDPQDVAQWPIVFREGRTSSGNPIIHGAETVAVHQNDVFSTRVVGTGTSMEMSFYFLNFGESNNMCYIHIFLRNMSEYIKYNYMQTIRDKVAAYPDGYPWKGWQFHWAYGNVNFGATQTQGWALNSEKETHAIFENDGVVPVFTGNPAMDCMAMLKAPIDKTGQKMEFTAAQEFGYAAQWGYTGGKDIYNSYEYKRNYRMLRGKYYQGPPWLADQYSPWTGRHLNAFPDRIYEGDEPYWSMGWIWGPYAYMGIMNWGEFHDFAPRDTASVDMVRMFVQPKNPPYSFPQPLTDNLANPEPAAQMSNVNHYIDVAHIVYDANYLLPETPIPPPLTVIPGDQKVTLTWSDINVNTPDAYYSFLQKHPELDPNQKYKEYDFEGYRVYRNFTGPSNDHAEKIFECSKTAKNIQYYYVDKKDLDYPLSRMFNGLKIWYALVPFDKNFDPTTGAAMSLPDLASGKTWNRPGSTGLYTIMPRTDASNYRSSGLLGGITFTPVLPTPFTDSLTAHLQGDGKGNLLEAPKVLGNLLQGIIYVPINNERITEPKKLTLLCSDVNYYDLGCPGNRVSGSRMMKIVDGSKEGLAAELGGYNLQTETLILNGPVDKAGIDYAVQTTFQGLYYADAYFRLLFTINLGSYTGGLVQVVSSSGCGPTAKPGAAPSNVAYTKSAQLEVTWKDAGAGNLTIDVKDLTRGIVIPPAEYPDGWGWGFMIPQDYGYKIWGSGQKKSGAYYNEAFIAKTPKAERTVKMLNKMPASNTGEFALWLNGLVWSIHGNGTPESPAPGGITMPAPGTVWIINNAFGTWNSTKTEYTQAADLPSIGDKWEFNVRPMTLAKDSINLSKIRVVPNPYIASSVLDLSADNRRIEFIYLPDRCTIRIYTLGGNLVNVLNHIGSNRNGWSNYQDWDRLDVNNNPMEFTGYDNHSGTEPWNLRNRFGQTVASGLYFFHVTDSRGKQQIGKFYIVN